MSAHRLYQRKRWSDSATVSSFHPCILTRLGTRAHASTGRITRGVASTPRIGHTHPVAIAVWPKRDDNNEPRWLTIMTTVGLVLIVGLLIVFLIAQAVGWLS